MVRFVMSYTKMAAHVQSRDPHGSAHKLSAHARQGRGCLTQDGNGHQQHSAVTARQPRARPGTGATSADHHWSPHSQVRTPCGTPEK